MQPRSFRPARASLTGLVAIGLLFAVVLAAVPGVAAASVVVPTATTSKSADDTAAVTLDVPSGTRTGDMLVASIAYRVKKRDQTLDIKAPAGWTLAARADRGATDGLAVFTHIAEPGMKSATWTMSPNGAVVAFMGAFSGVDPVTPVEAARTGPAERAFGRHRVSVPGSQLQRDGRRDEPQSDIPYGRLGDGSNKIYRRHRYFQRCR